MILLDVNVVVAAGHADHADHELVRHWFDELLEGTEPFCVPDGFWVSFVRLSSSSRVFEVPMSIDDAFSFVRSVRDHPNHVAVSLGDSHLTVFEDLCRRFDVSGDLVPDAYLAAIAIDQGCALASLDRDFARFEDLDWVIPGPAS